MRRLITLGALVGYVGVIAQAYDFEFVVAVPVTPLDTLVLQIVRESILAAGSIVNFAYDNTRGVQELSWGYPELLTEGWVVSVPTILRGFGGLVTVVAPEDEVEPWRQARNLSQVRSIPAEAILRTDAPWLVHWQKAALPYRIDNSREVTPERGSYLVVSLMDLAVVRERMPTPGAPIPVVLSLPTDVALWLNPALVPARRRGKFEEQFRRGWARLESSGRLEFLLRSWFLSAFQEFGLSRLRPILVGR